MPPKPPELAGCDVPDGAPVGAPNGLAAGADDEAAGPPIPPNIDLNAGAPDVVAVLETPNGLADDEAAEPPTPPNSGLKAGAPGAVDALDAGWPPAPRLLKSDMVGRVRAVLIAQEIGELQIADISLALFSSRKLEQGPAFGTCITRALNSRNDSRMQVA